MYKILILFILFSFSAKAQLVSDSLLIDGHYRVFYFNTPSTQTKNASLVFAIHGSGGDPLNFMKNAVKLEQKAALENFILVYPKGYKSYWNECRKASTVAANLENIDEDAFFSGMIGYFKTKYQINEKQVFASGFSGGGQMAYRMGITMPSKFRAICAMVANMPTAENMDCPESKVAISTLIINGTADPVNPYAGGEMKSAGLTLGNVRSTDESFRYWAALSGYSGVPVRKVLPDPDTTNSITVESFTFQKKKSPEVTLFKVNNGKHEFQTDIDFFSEAWTFFKRQL
ncbi:alpha/beta hydrolase family esterase [Dyadobacter psychrotolerans]|uniref:Poly(3-hydroxybutyrate) depolymerase n=1 Tax=Dyadobacter psychrotolerans TaxID=2541721 RepID=A0A4R5DMB6_9BACT|nr:poly(3-hydroxybutyrate) depolymerase [Dyadobacter psychrotolerans]TDE15416.1 poly(3-hydroxybutyrate) depolymerase [Dyadobacter psychrotolerans]